MALGQIRDGKIGRFVHVNGDVSRNWAENSVCRDRVSSGLQRRHRDRPGNRHGAHAIVDDSVGGGAAVQGVVGEILLGDHV